MEGLSDAGLTWRESAQAWQEIPVEDDPLVRMPGTQPDPALQNIASPSAETVGVEAPESACNNCHKGDPVAPSDQGMPFFQWQGSMMAQAARDPIFWATLTVAAQDSIWAAGTPNATDICLRCHFPEGWMGGRSSDGLNASAMTGSDFDGVHCGVCHRMYDPFFNNAEVREGVPTGYLAEYWDEAIGYDFSTQLAETSAADAALAGSLTCMNGTPLYEANNPKEAGYTENGGGQVAGLAPEEDRRQDKGEQGGPADPEGQGQSKECCRYPHG